MFTYAEIDLKDENGGLLLCDLKVEIYYDFDGKYYPATYNEPEEWPDLEIEKIIAIENFHDDDDPTKEILVHAGEEINLKRITNKSYSNLLDMLWNTFEKYPKRDDDY